MSATIDTPQDRTPGLWVPVAASARRIRERWESAQPLTTYPRSEWPVPLRRVRAVGLVLLAAEFIAFSFWSALLASRSALAYDFATHQQALFLIAHGVLDPFSTVQHFWYWQDHGELLFWVFAPLELISHSPNVLLCLQNAATIGAELIAFLWICDIAVERARLERTLAIPVAIAVLGLVLLVADPWTIWSDSQDIHTEAFSVLFAIGAARALFAGGRGFWVFGVLGLLTGDVGTTYMCAVAFGAMLCGSYAWRRGLGLLGLSLLWFLVLQVAHANHGDIIVQYSSLVGGQSPTGSVIKVTAGAILKGIATHPGRVLSALWGHRLNAWAVLSAAGLIGWLWPPVLVPCLLVIAEADLGSSLQFSAPSFQQLLIGIFAAVGTVGVLSSLLGRIRSSRRWVVFPLMGLMAAITIGWAAVWIPQLSTRWLRTSSAGAAVLNRVRAQISTPDEVVADNGVVGGFADHRYTYTLDAAIERVPVRSRRLWFLLAPFQGIETASTEGQLADIAQLLHTPGVRLASAAQGVFALEWTPPAGQRVLALGKDLGHASLPAWLVAGDSGRVIRSGSPLHWYVRSTDMPGYVVARDYADESPGTYQARVTLSVSAPTNVELWSDTRASRLLARTVVKNTRGRRTLVLTATVHRAAKPPVYDGWGIWGDQNINSQRPQIEVRVWTPGDAGAVDVYSLSIRRIQPG